MKRPACFSEGSLLVRLCPLFAGITWLLAMLMYLCTTLVWPVLVFFFVWFSAFTALFGWKGAQHKACRILSRIGLLLPSVLMTALIAVYYFLLLSEGYELSLIVQELSLLITMHIGATLLFASPCLALLALQGRKADLLINSIVAVLNLLLTGFTVFYVTPLKNLYGEYLLVTLLRHPVWDALFLIGAVLTAVASVRLLLEKKAQLNGTP